MARRFACTFQRVAHDMEIVTQADARMLFDYESETGRLVWKTRPLEHFKDASYQGRWNGRFAGKSAGSLSVNGYLRINILGKFHLVHRLVWLWVHGDWPSGFVDHINGISCDNRMSNLRVVDKEGNARNARIPTTNTSGNVGVSYNARDGSWHAYIGVGRGQRKSLGHFRSISDAVAVRQSAERFFGYHPNHGRAA
jgi:hypothetical protein